jgi:broad specificity phosphatase PhoE
MKLYLVRHGESISNSTRTHQSSDVSLSPLGHKQAKLLAKRFKTIDIDLILSSHYTRAHQTAEYISALIKKPIKIEENLREIRRPSSLLGKSIDDFEVMKVKSLIAKNTDKNWHYEDEENIHELIERAKIVLATLQEYSAENILAVSHGRFIVAIICAVTMGDELTPALYSQVTDNVLISNTGITVLVKKNDRWVLQTWNDDAHLGHL